MIQQIARDALVLRKLIRLPFAGGDILRVTTKQVHHRGERRVSHVVDRLIDEIWKKEGAGKFDGQLVGADDVGIGDSSVEMWCRPIRYRDYVSIDQVIDAHPEHSFALAIGVHAILLSGDEVICLRLENGRIALPGGAVDAEDLAPGATDALRRAAIREVQEETGIDLSSLALTVTGIYVGGYPTHILVMIVSDLGPTDIGGKLAKFKPTDRFDRVRRVEAVPFSYLVKEISNVPFVVRAALQSLHHWQGEGSFEMIET
jgi:8-oxo-dGTP pyrophosphatase MutT (NUDIX family)